MTNIDSTSRISTPTTYCTVEDVEKLLQISDRTSSTKPSKQDIEQLILWAENKIDRITHNSWRLNTVYNEYYDFRDFLGVRYIDTPRRVRFYDDRGKIVLRHRNIRKILKMDVWDGSQYVDYVTNYTEGRGEDYWVDYKEGVIYFWSRYPWRVRNAVKIDYQWGEYEIPEDIKEACAKMVARQLIASDDYSVLFPEGTSNIPLQSKSEIWKEDIEEILKRRTEIIYY